MLIHINGEPFVKVEAKLAAFTANPAEGQAQLHEDIAQAMVLSHAAVSNTPMSIEHARSLAPFVTLRWLQLRQPQLEALIALLVEQGRCDASLIAILTDNKVSDVKKWVASAEAAVTKARDLATTTVAPALTGEVM